MAPNNGTAYGRRLVPHVVDELAATDPTRVYAAIPKTADLKDGYRDVTMAELAGCVDFMAAWLENKFGKSTTFETITYVGLSDLKGITTLLGAIKAGYKLLVPSPRNPPAINLHLMNATCSSKVLFAAELRPLMKPFEALASSANFEPVPSFDEMLDGGAAAEPYLFKKTFEEARNDPIIVLHSSGSTGLPKPITMTHGSVAAHDNDHNIPAPEGRKKQDTTVFTLDGDNRRVYSILPFFHLGGFVFFIDHAILNNLTLVLGPPTRAPDAELLREVAQQQDLRAIMSVPAILEQLLHDPDGIDLLKGLEWVGYGGSPLSAPIGDRISSVIKLRNFIGSTETYPLPELEKAPEDWTYHEFMPTLKHEMRLYDDEMGTYELIIFADESNRDSAPVFHNLPGENPFYTKDLFTRHPEKPNLYKYYGRKDDILVLSNGEKVNPIPFEQVVQADPAVKGVLLTANGRTQSILVVEPREDLDEAERAQLLEKLRPRIEEANGHVSGPGRVARNMVICATPDKHFARTGKGTVVRKLTQDSYQQEIDRLYSASSQTERLVAISLKPKQKLVYEPADIVEFLRQALAVSLSSALSIGADEDFFAHGLDSVQTIEFTATLKHNLKSLTSDSVAWIVPRVIFQYSTISKLSRVLSMFLNDGILPQADSQSSRIQAMNDLVGRHTKGLPTKPALDNNGATQKISKLNVAVIGSTGYVGSHLVATLLSNPKIAHIYCLNRGKDMSVVEKKTLSKVDGETSKLLDKVTFITIELGTSRLGLVDADYQRLQDNVDVIVYNAWRLDFGLALRSFDPLLRATRDIIDLSLASKRNPHLIFVSSTSSVAGLVADGSSVPEAAVEDPLAAMNSGYGQSKLAAERILTTAARQAAVPISVARVGQIGGPSSGKGPWAEQPWISAVIRSSATLGTFPNPVMPIDWVPVDVVVGFLESVVLEPVKDIKEPQFFNVVSESQPWSLLLDSLPDTTRNAVKKVVPLPEWVAELTQASQSEAVDLATLPAARLVDFYTILGHGLESANYDTELINARIGQEVGPVKREVLAEWLKSWDI